jgi:hypothetical protein
MYNVLLGVKNVLFDVIHDEKTKNNFVIFCLEANKFRKSIFGFLITQ